MPLFFFHVRSAQGLERDAIGLELPSAEAAYLEAFEAVPGLALELLARGGSPGQYAFEVVDRRGMVLWDIPFAEIFERIGRQHVQSRRTG